MIAVSIVSHGHGAMLAPLLAQLRACPAVTRILVTINVPENHGIVADETVRLIDNASPKGFGANHNAAFRHCAASHFCVLNPDITLVGDPFPPLLDCLMQYPQAAVAAPLIVSPAGRSEDSMRRFPSLCSLLSKAMTGDEGRHPAGSGTGPVFPDWVAGMFMLFRATDYAALGGFDESYHLYYEDVDLCKRIAISGKRVAACPAVSAVHDARRASHANLRHLRWHLASMLRYLWRYRAIG